MRLTYREQPEITIDSDTKTFTIGNVTYNREYFSGDDEGVLLAMLAEDLTEELPNTDHAHLVEDTQLIAELANEA
jgi:thiazole synthase ThiGH ThiG subunit